MPDAIDKSYARAFYRQAKEDLAQAELLFQNNRWTGVVLLSRASAEKALKAALFWRLGRVAYAAAGLPKLHYIIRRLSVGTPPKGNIDPALDTRLGATLHARIDALEQFNPTQNDNKNPEYPWDDPPGSAAPVAPVDSFVKREAKTALVTARQTVRGVRRIHATI